MSRHDEYEHIPSANVDPMLDDGRPLSPRGTPQVPLADAWAAGYFPSVPVPDPGDLWQEDNAEPGACRDVTHLFPKDYNPLDARRPRIYNEGL